MAMKLSKTEDANRDALITEIDEKFNALREAIDGMNNIIEAARARVQDAESALNEAIEAARSFADDLHSEKQSEFDDRSEKWQESDTGQSVGAWLSELESIGTMSSIEVDLPDDIDVPDEPDEVDLLRQLATDPTA